jgi:hypothetical protein
VLAALDPNNLPLPLGCEPLLNTCWGGGGLLNLSEPVQGTVSMARTIIANNSVRNVEDPRGVGPDCAGPILSEGFNAIRNVTDCTVRPSYVLQGRPTNDRNGVNPRLGELQDNGEAGDPHFPLRAGSPLIDADGPVSSICTVAEAEGRNEKKALAPAFSIS